MTQMYTDRKAHVFICVHLRTSASSADKGTFWLWYGGLESLFQRKLDFLNMVNP